MLINSSSLDWIEENPPIYYMVFYKMVSISMGLRHMLTRKSLWFFPNFNNVNLSHFCLWTKEMYIYISNGLNIVKFQKSWLSITFLHFKLGFRTNGTRIKLATNTNVGFFFGRFNGMCLRNDRHETLLWLGVKHWSWLELTPRRFDTWLWKNDWWFIDKF